MIKGKHENDRHTDGWTKRHLDLLCCIFADKKERGMWPFWILSICNISKNNYIDHFAIKLIRFFCFYFSHCSLRTKNSGSLFLEIDKLIIS